MSEKKSKVTLEIGGAISGTLNRTFAIATGNTKKLGAEIKTLKQRAIELKEGLKNGVGGKEAEAELARLERRISSLKGAIGSIGKIKNIGSAIGKTWSTTTRAIATDAVILGGIGAVAYKLAKGIGEYADNAAEAASALSMDTNALIKYKYAADDVGTGAENLTKSIAKMQKTLEDARGSKGSKVFQLLKLDANKLSRQKPEQQIEAIAEAFSKYNGRISKTAIAMAIFGKSGSAMVNFLSLGKDGLAEYGKEAEEVGLTLSDDLIKAGDEFGRQQLRLGSTLRGTSNIIGAAFLPVINDLLDSFGQFVRGHSKEIKKWAEDTGAWAKENLPGIAKDVFELSKGVAEFGKSAVKFMEPFGGAKTLIGGFLVLPFLPAAAAILSLGAAMIGAIPAVWGMATALSAVSVAGMPLALIIGAVVIVAISFWRAIKEVSDNWDTYAWAFNETVGWMVEKWDALKTSAMDFGYSISGAVSGAFSTLKTTVGDWFTWIEAKFRAVSDTIGSVFSGRGAMRVNPGGAVAGAPAVDGARATGGPVSAGKRYLVGERGPEIFAPRTSGQIIPNGGGSHVDNRTYNITINATPGMNERSLADLVLARLDGRQAALASGALYD